MPTYIHGFSGFFITGIALAPGACLHATDCYASASGNWEVCPIPGATLNPGAGPVWIRPGEFPEAIFLLENLVQQSLILVKTETHWEMIPSLRWKNSGRLEWRVPETWVQSIQDLRDFGFIANDGADKDAFDVTRRAHSFLAEQFTPR